jgi:hypothetical protein
VVPRGGAGATAGEGRKREIKFSLGTSDPALAKIRQAQELARWRARFVELGREIEHEALSRAPSLVDGFLEAMAQRNGDYDNVGLVVPIKHLGSREDRRPGEGHLSHVAASHPH